MEPRWTGICGALAMRFASVSKIAHEKSNRSLMLTDKAVFCSVCPICSAIAMRRLLKTSSMIGSASVPMAGFRTRGLCRLSTNWLSGSTRLVHSGSMTVVALGSMTMAGPSTVFPGCMLSRR